MANNSQKHGNPRPMQIQAQAAIMVEAAEQSAPPWEGLALLRRAGGARQQQQQQQSGTAHFQLQHPCMCWDLRLLPPALEGAYWSERTAIHRCYDSALAWLMLAMAVSGWWQWLWHGSLEAANAIFAPSILVLSLWVWAAGQHWYSQPRLRSAAVAAARVAMLQTVLLAFSKGGSEVVQRVVIPGSARATVLAQALLLGELLLTPLQLLLVPLAFPLQLLFLAAKTAVLLTRNATVELIAATAPPLAGQAGPAAAAVGEMLQSWQALVQGAAPFSLFEQHAVLSGRSCDMLLLLVLAHLSLAGVVAWACYVFLWIDKRLWLMGKLRAMGYERTDLFEVAGVFVSQEQVKAMLSSPVSNVLLDFSMGRAAGVVAHAVVLGSICHVAFLAAQLLVWQLLPQALPAGLLDVYCPVAAA